MNFAQLTFPVEDVIADGGEPSSRYGTAVYDGGDVTLPAAGGGRGAFPSNGRGGTLDSTGMKPGRFYRSRSVSAPKTVLAPGLVGFRAARDATEVSVNDYAVYRGVMFLQKAFGEPVVDGILGPKTDAKIKAWQATKGLKQDGVYGPATARMLLTPEVVKAAKEVDPTHESDLVKIVTGTITYESAWDHSAIGVQDPHDMGIAQVHLPIHTALSVDDALDPLIAIPWMTRFIDSNLSRMNYNVRDAVAAYNLGVGGARLWIADGRPDMWQPSYSSVPRDVKRYIDNILA